MSANAVHLGFNWHKFVAKKKRKGEMNPPSDDNIATSTGINCNASRQSLMKRVGGPQMLEQMVDILSTKILSDDSLAQFFEDVDIDQFESHQYRLLQLAMTKVPLRFPEHMLYKHHRLFATMGLNEKHFDRLMDYMRETLDECEIPCDAIAHIMATLLPLRQVFQDGSIKFTKMDAVSKFVGGDDVVDAAMEAFNWHVSENKDLQEILVGYDVEAIKEHQRRFFRLALTGFPDSVNIQQYLRGKHAHLFERGLNVRHFDALAGSFLDTLQTLRVSANILEKAKDFLQVAREAFKTKGEVVEGEKIGWSSTCWLNDSEL